MTDNSNLEEKLLLLTDITGAISYNQLVKLSEKTPVPSDVMRKLKWQNRITNTVGEILRNRNKKNVSPMYISAVWFFLSYIDKADYFIPGTYPTIIDFFVNGTEYEVLACEQGTEVILNKAASLTSDPPIRFVIIEDKKQIPLLKIKNAKAFCIVDNESGKVTSYKIK